MDEPLTLRFRYSQQDYVRAVRLHLSGRMHLKRDLAVAAVGGLPGVGVSA
jgi:hypothetical protein